MANDTCVATAVGFAKFSATSMQASVVELRSGSESLLISTYAVKRPVSNLCIEARIVRHYLCQFHRLSSEGLSISLMPDRMF